MNTLETGESTVKIFRAIPSERIRLLVFDLDGTLADTKTDLCNSVNATLRRFHLAPLTDASISGFIGDGTLMLVRRSVGLSFQIPVDQVERELLTDAYSFFLHHYLHHLLDNTTLYPGVVDGLNRLHEEAPLKQWSLFVLTNKPRRAATAILNGLGIAHYFTRIYGGDSFPMKKPDPSGLLHIMQEADARPTETVMIGDSKADVQTARNAGTLSLGCSYGFNPGDFTTSLPDVLVNAPKDWTTLLLQRSAHQPDPLQLIHSLASLSKKR